MFIAEPFFNSGVPVFTVDVDTTEGSFGPCTGAGTTKCPQEVGGFDDFDLVYCCAPSET